MSAGAFHTCALAADHRAWCWGRNVYGGLGDGTTDPRTAPTPVAGNLRFDSLTAGYEYTCGLTSIGTAWCWGENFGGQLGDGTTTNRLVPVQVQAPERLRSISAGEAHTCAVSVTHRTYCWGAPLATTGAYVLRPGEQSPSLAVVSSGYEIACGLAAGGDAWCWGLLVPGIAFSDTTQLSTELPMLVNAGALTFTTIGAGTKHACGLDPEGSAWCWGLNVAGQVGDSTYVTAPVPHRVVGGHHFARLSAHSPAHACALTALGEAWCWGANSLGLLGDATTTTRPYPVAVSGGLRFAMIATGFEHSCGITPAGELFCWGYNGDGRLGVSATGSVTSPALVPAPDR